MVAEDQRGVGQRVGRRWRRRRPGTERAGIGVDGGKGARCWMDNNTKKCAMKGDDVTRGF